MDIQSAPPPSAATPNTSVVGVPPQLGAPVPGATGGLPALSGLSVVKNPMAEELRSKGRGEDTMLVHMTPNEVNSLQGLAMATGGSLTINPETGLPEAGWLGKLLPTLLGVGLNFILPGSGLVASLGGKAATAGLLTAAGTTAITGDLQKGLAAGLGAFGGASLAGGIQGALGGAAKTAATTAPASSAVTGAAEQLASQQAGQLANIGTQVGKLGSGLGGGSMGMGMNAVAPELVRDVAPTMVKGLSGFGQGFANTAKGTMGGILSKAAVPAAISGVVGSFAPSGGVPTATGQIDNSYQGPYFAQDRRRITDPEGPVTSKQRRHFAVSMPEIYNTTGQLVQPGSMTPQGTPILQPVARSKPKKGENLYDFQYVNYMGGPAPAQNQMAQMYPSIYGNGMGYKEGGEVQIADGGFVVDARTVSEAGNGFTEKGFKDLERLGGIPLKGPGDGVSDSIPARIGRSQPARVAAGEVYMPPEAVRRIGKGDPKRGAQKLYAMMDRAHQATKRGQKRNILKGLA